MALRRTLTAATAMVGLAVSLLVAPSPASGADAPPPHAAAVTAGAIDLSGDFIVAPDEGPAVLVPEAPPLGRSAGGLLSTNLEGFRSWGVMAGNRGSYTIRLVTSPGVEALRPLATTVAGELTAITGSPVSVAGGQVASIDGPLPDGEIRIVVSASTPCGGSVIGCGEVQTTGGVGVRGRVWITPSGMALTDARRTSLLRHEIGHTLGLEHYQPLFGGVAQVMASGLPENLPQPYGTGDRNGLRFLAPRCDDRPVDVGASSRFCDEIGWTVRNSVLGGWPDGTFRPGATLSRQAMASLLWRYAGEPVAPAGPSFGDVPGDHRFASAIAWLVSVGIADGYPDGTFRPTAPVSRQAMAAFLHRYLVWRNGSLPSGAYSADFTDVPPGHRFRTEIRSLASHAIVQGSYQWDGSQYRLVFDTDSPVSRQAVAAFVFRADNL
jgi:hypothetical protein